MDHRASITPTIGAVTIDPYPHTVSPGPWTIVRTLLHSPHATDRRQAVHSILHLIAAHGWRGIPPLTDEDIHSLWSTLITDLLLPADYEWSSVWMGMIRLVGVSGSADRVAWLWEHIKTHVSHHQSVSAVETALRWRIPIWMAPDGLIALHHALLVEPDNRRCHILWSLRTTLWEWITHPEPEIRTRMDVLLTEVLLQVIPHDPMNIAIWIDTIGVILSTNPTLATTIPSLIDTIASVCPLSHSGIANAVLTVFATLRPFDHPRFRPTIDTILRTVEDGGVCVRAAALLMDALIASRDLTAMYQVIEHAWKTVTGPDPLPGTSGAIAILRTALYREYSAPMIASYLRNLSIDSPALPAILTGIETLSPTVLSTIDSISLALFLLKTPERDRGITMLIRLWGRGCDAAMMSIIPGNTSLSGTDRITILRAALCHPQVGAAAAHHIMALDPHNAARHLLTGITDYYHPKNRLPSGILPMVMQACRDLPHTVSATVMQALWNTDPQAALEIIEHMVECGTVEMDVIKSVRFGWYSGDPHRIGSLLKRVIQQYGTSDAWGIMRAVVTTVLDGIGVGTSTVVLDVWHHMVRAVPPYRLAMIADMCAYHSDIWNRGSIPDVITMLHRLVPSRTSEIDADTHALMTTAILRSLGHGWGHGNDAAILEMVDTIVTDTIRHAIDQSHRDSKLVALMQVLRFGWGRGMDHAIGVRLQTILAWLDATMERWDETGIGAAAMDALTAGGGDPSLGWIDAHDGVPIDPATLKRARQAFACWLASTRPPTESSGHRTQ